MRFLLLPMAAATLIAAGPDFQFERVTPESIRLTDGGAPVLVYNRGIMRKEGVPEDRYRCCYVHPVWAPNGVEVTDDFPADHHHHRGIFWAWSVVEIKGERYDIWMMSNLKKRPLTEAKLATSGQSARLEVDNGWFTDTGRQVVREHVEITALPLEGQERKLRFKLTFEALEPVTLKGDPVDNKGYGGFSIRFAPRENTVIAADKGLEAEDSNEVPHPWAKLTADYEGGKASLRIDGSPDNPGYPNGWCIRHYGFLGVNYPGNGEHELRPGEPLTLEYTVTVASGS